MAIIRSKREARFTVINNCVFERNQLSWGAMGMLCYLLSKPDNWSVSPAELIKTTDGSAKKSGRDAVYAILDELMLVGFVTRAKQANGNMDYTVFDEPVTDNPYYGKDVLREIPITEKPDTDNPTLVNTERTLSTDKKIVSTEESLSLRKKQTHPCDKKAAQEIVDSFNDIFVELPAVHLLTDQRISAIKSRWNDLAALKISKTPEFVADRDSMIETFAGFFAWVAKSDFLMGRVESDKPFKCCFDWIFKPTNFAKILEGNYVNDRKAA